MKVSKFNWSFLAYKINKLNLIARIDDIICNRYAFLPIQSTALFDIGLYLFRDTGLYLILAFRTFFTDCKCIRNIYTDCSKVMFHDWPDV